MAISLDSIYKPVNDFFLKKFQTSSDSPIIFRFDKFGSVISDDDFSNPLNNANEQFSDFVNRIPIEDKDGISIFFSDKKIDQSYYYELLNPALPYILKDLDATLKENIQDSFTKIHAQATNQFEKLWKARSNGIADKYWSSIASPSNWYETTNNEIWEHFSFVAVEEDTNTDPKKEVSKIWKLRLNDDKLQETLSTLNEDNTVIAPKNFVPKLTSQSIDVQAITHTGLKATTHNFIQPTLIGAKFRPLIEKPFEDTKVNNAIAAIDIKKNFHNAFVALNLINRVTVANHLKQNAPVKPVTSTNISIEFDYCLVNINRPWLFNAFLDNTDWCIPRVSKGDYNTTGNLSLLPISFIAIKGLKISAKWSDSDMENAKEATDFGPFQIDSNFDAKQNIGHAGIQVIGWLLHKMKDLPPNDYQSIS